LIEIINKNNIGGKWQETELSAIKKLKFLQFKLRGLLYVTGNVEKFIF
jgi:hypothetical protein